LLIVLRLFRKVAEIELMLVDQKLRCRNIYACGSASRVALRSPHYEYPLQEYRANGERSKHCKSLENGAIFCIVLEFVAQSSCGIDKCV
jgi:hypothetical protein